MHQFNISRTLGAAILSFILISLLFKLIYPPPLDATGSIQGSEALPIEIPWTFSGRNFGNVVNLNLDVNYFTPRVWQIIPDDNLRAISVNDKPVDLSNVGSGLRDYGKGFEYDFSQYFHDGERAVVRFLFDNGGGPGGLNLSPQLGKWICLAVMAGFLPFILVLSRDFNLLPEQKWLLTIALIAIAFYWADTPWTVRTYDVNAGSGHYDYINYIATKHALPVPNEGWTFYHPPLYYLGGSVFWQWAQWLDLPKPEMIRVYGLFLWIVFLVASAGALRRVLGHQFTAVYAATAALVLWPGGVMRSVGIGNDLGLYACAAMAAWFMVAWRDSGAKKHLLWLALFCSLAMLCKSNGLPLIAAAGLLISLRMLPKSGVAFSQAFKETLVFSGLVALGIACSFMVRFYYFMKGVSPDWLVSNAWGLNFGLKVPANLKAFIPLDIPTFLTSPWVSAWEDKTGRYNFWNYTLRSSISGEFQFSGQAQTWLAYVIGVILLMLVLTGMLYLAFRIKEALTGSFWKVFYSPYFPMFLLGFFWMASLLVLRYKYPYSCSNDFRYVLPVILPFVICCARVAMGRFWLWAFGIGSGLFFVLL